MAGSKLKHAGHILQHEIQRAGLKIDIDELQENIKQISLILDVSELARKQPHELARVREEIVHRYPELSGNERIMKQTVLYARARFSQRRKNFYQRRIPKQLNEGNKQLQASTSTQYARDGGTGHDKSSQTPRTKTTTKKVCKRCFALDINLRHIYKIFRESSSSSQPQPVSNFAHTTTTTSLNRS